MKAKRKLFSIKPNEVSIVREPANLVKFLVMKDDGTLEINISSNGTQEGTKIKVNGEEIKGLTSINLWYNAPLPGSSVSMSGPALSCSYCKVVEVEDGFSRTETYTLNKGEHTMDKELVKLLKSYFGDKWTMIKEDLSEDAVKALKEALITVNKYKDEFPDELKGAVGMLAKYASSGYGSEKEEETEEEKKRRLAEEAAAAAANKKSADAVAKQITDVKTEITKSITDLTKAVTDGNEAGKKLATDVASLAQRLDAVEKNATVRKGVEGQEDNNKGGDNRVNITDKFPSIPI